jgi:hypothetical protein
MSSTIQTVIDNLTASLKENASKVLTDLTTELYIPLLVEEPDKYFALAKALRNKDDLEKLFDSKITMAVDDLRKKDPVDELLTDDVVLLIRTMVHPTTLPASTDPLTPGMTAAVAPLAVASVPSGITALHGALTNMLFDKVYGEATHRLLESFDGKSHVQLMEFLRFIKQAIHNHPQSTLITPLPVGTTEKDLLATKLPDISCHRVGPYWFNKVLPKKANFQMSHGKSTCIKVGEKFKEVKMDVLTDADVADIQAVIDGLGATHGGRKIRYCDAPWLNDVKRMMLCIFTLELNSKNQWVFKQRIGANRVVSHDYFRKTILDVRDVMEATFAGIVTHEALNLHWDLELYDHRHTKYAELFRAVEEWRPYALKSYATDVLKIMRPVPSSSTSAPSGGGDPVRVTEILEKPTTDYSVIMARRAEQEANKKIRNTTAKTDVYHHNATMFVNCHETSEMAVRILPVIKRLSKYFPDKYKVHIDSQDGSHTIQQYLTSLDPPVSTVNRNSDGKYDALNDKAPLDPDTVYIGDWNDNPIKDDPAGVFALLKHPALARVRTVLLRCDPKKMKYSRHNKWVEILTTALEDTKFDRFAWLNSGRMHNPHFYVMFTRDNVSLMKNFPTQFRNVIVPEVCTIADHCETLVQGAYKVALRPDMTQFLLDLLVHYPKMELGLDESLRGPRTMYTYLGKCKAAVAGGFDTQLEKVEFDKDAEDY